MKIKNIVKRYLLTYGVEFKINSVTENLDNFYDNGIDYEVDVEFKFNTKIDYHIVWANFIYPNISYEEGHYLFKLLSFTHQKVRIILPIRVSKLNV